MIKRLFLSNISLAKKVGYSKKGKNIQSEDEPSTNEQDEDKLELVAQLHRIIKPFMLRRTKEESLKDLPPKKEIHLYVGLSDL